MSGFGCCGVGAVSQSLVSTRRHAQRQWGSKPILAPMGIADNPKRKERLSLDDEVVR